VIRADLIDVDRARRLARRVLLAAGLALGGVAALAPRLGNGPESIDARGGDLVIALDVSRSMLAGDVAPTRLARAKEQVVELAARSGGDRLGLVLFAGEARLAVPLTQDLDSFASLVARADVESVLRGGSDLGAALEAALAVLRPTDDGEPAPRSIVLLTDGEDLAGRGLRAARQCRERDVRVHCVGFGTSLGSKIVIESGHGPAFLRDRSGSEVLSALDADGLLRIAAATGGEFVDGGAAGHALLELYDRRIAPKSSGAVDVGERRAPASRYQWPLLAALLLWIVELGLTDRGRP